MNFNFIKGKSKRKIIFALITFVSIVSLFAGNLVLSIFVPQESIYIDMTEEGLYTLTDAMKRECDFVEKLEGNVKIIFCDDPDRIIESETTRVVYFMALQLQDRYEDKISVECINGSLKPTALAPYKTTSLTEIKTSDVIISYGDRYRIVNASKFWTVGSDGARWSYNGEYRMASILRSISAINQPSAYFLVGHGEEVYDPTIGKEDSETNIKYAYFADLLRERGLTVKLLSLDGLESIPEDCALLIINNPTLDLKTNPDEYNSHSYLSETDLLDRYLVKKQGAIMVTKDYGVSLPILESFLSEWGISFGNTLLKDSVASLTNELNTNTDLIASYNTDVESYGYAIYGDYASVSSAPRTIFSNTGYVKCSFKESAATPEPGAANTRRQYASFLTSSAAAKEYAKNSLTGEYIDLAGEAGVRDLAAVVARGKLDVVTNEYVYSYIFCAATSDFFTNDLLGNSSYANYDIVSSLVNNMSRLDDYASIDLGGLSMNSSSYGGKQLRYSVLSKDSAEIYSSDAKEVIEYNYGITSGMMTGIAIAVFVIPVIVLGVGIVVCLRRRYL